MTKKDKKLNSTEVVKKSDDFEKSRKAEIKIKLVETKAKQKIELNELKKKNRSILSKIEQDNKDKLKSIKDKKERTKVRFEQYAALHEQEDKLFYTEYEMEVRHKKERDEISSVNVKTDGNTLVDADAASGNAFLNFFKLMFRDFKVSIAEKPRIIFGLLCMVTGIIIGFSIDVFITIAYNFSSDYAYVGLVVFIFELLGMLNIVNGFRICGEGRLKSVVSAAICTIGEIITGVAWIYLVANCLTGTSAEASDIAETYILIIVCILTGIIGTIGGFFTYDREFVKEIR